MIADLSYKDTYGYYGLRAEPTFDQLVKTFKKKPTKIPVPKDREWKYWALGPYRSYILDAGQRYSALEMSKIADQSTDKQKVTEQAAFHTQPSLGGSHPAWEAYHDYSDTVDAYEVALDAANEDYKQQQLETERIRREQLSSIGPNITDSTIMMHSDDLQEAQVPHVVPAPRASRSETGWSTGHQQYIAAGIPQAPEFPSFEELNLQLSTPPAPLISPSPHVQSARRVTASLGQVRQLNQELTRLSEHMSSNSAPAYDQMRQVARRRSDVDS
jgi:hypothetical protein